TQAPVYSIYLMLFSSLIPPPPRSPLFPYTTLFRSLSVFHSRVGASLQSQDPLGAAAAPALTPQSTPEVSSRSATPSTSATSPLRSEEHTSELQSRGHLVCRLLLDKKKNNRHQSRTE